MMRNPRMAVFAAAVMLFTICMSVVPSRALVGLAPIKDWTIGEPDDPSGSRASRAPFGQFRLALFPGGIGRLGLPLLVAGYSSTNRISSGTADIRETPGGQRLRGR